MSKVTLTPEVLGLVAERFKVLSEPVRLQILNCLRKRELTVSDIVENTGLTQTNVSKHLQLLHLRGIVSRRKEGLHVYYALADDRVFELCDLVCESIDAALTTRRRLMTPRARR